MNNDTILVPLADGRLAICRPIMILTPEEAMALGNNIAQLYPAKDQDVEKESDKK